MCHHLGRNLPASRMLLAGLAPPRSRPQTPSAGCPSGSDWLASAWSSGASAGVGGGWCPWRRCPGGPRTPRSSFRCASSATWRSDAPGLHVLPDDVCRSLYGTDSVWNFVLVCLIPKDFEPHLQRLFDGFCVRDFGALEQMPAGRQIFRIASLLLQRPHFPRLQRLIVEREGLRLSTTAHLLRRNPRFGFGPRRVMGCSRASSGVPGCPVVGSTGPRAHVSRDFLINMSTLPYRPKSHSWINFLISAVFS